MEWSLEIVKLFTVPAWTVFETIHSKTRTQTPILKFWTLLKHPDGIPPKNVIVTIDTNKYCTD